MSALISGQIYDGSMGDMEFTLPENLVLIWKDGAVPEAIFCESQQQLPKSWFSGTGRPLKIVGSFEALKAIFPRFNLPPGSKLIDLSPGAIIRMNISCRSLQFSGKRRKRVLIVDDSATMRKLLTRLIGQFEGWIVIGEASGPNEIPSMVETHYPDLVTLDLNMGDINGAEAMRTILAPLKIPTLLISSQGIKDGSLVMEALAAGALDYLQKPESGKWEILQEELHEKMEAALRFKWMDDRKPKAFRRPLTVSRDIDLTRHLIVIGSSTGGTQALEEIFLSLPPEIPPVLVTQHIPAGFSKALAERLNKLCPFEVKEAEDGDEIRPGRILIAPGGYHLRLRGSGRYVEVVDAPPVNRFRPSVDVMFSSVAKAANSKVIAIILTGMGKDGAEGMLELKSKGAITIAQDEASSVVFGMPKEAIRIGAVDNVKSLSEISEFIYKCIST